MWMCCHLRVSIAGVRSWFALSCLPTTTYLVTNDYYRVVYREVDWWWPIIATYCNAPDDYRWVSGLISKIAESETWSFWLYRIKRHCTIDVYCHEILQHFCYQIFTLRFMCKSGDLYLIKHVWERHGTVPQLISKQSKPYSYCIKRAYLLCC